MVRELRHAATEEGILLTTNHVCGMFGLFFTSAESVANFSEVTACNLERFKQFFHGMLEEGVYLAPSPYEAGFISKAHGDEEIEKTVTAARNVFKRLTV